MLMIGDLEVKEIFRNFVAKNKEWRYDEKRIRKSAGVLRESLARKDGGDSWHRALG